MIREKHVTETSASERAGIVKTSVQALDNRVVGKPTEMKKRFVMPIVNDDGLPSVTRVIDRVVNETEEALDEVARYLVDKVVNGISAYDVAVANGFKGTEKQWLESLKGEPGHSEPAYIEEIAINNSGWEKVETQFKYRIAQTTHNLKTIHSIVCERKTALDMYENMIYSYKRYTSGSVAIIVDEKIDMRIIIKGEK